MIQHILNRYYGMTRQLTRIPKRTKKNKSVQTKSPKNLKKISQNIYHPWRFPDCKTTIWGQPTNRPTAQQTFDAKLCANAEAWKTCSSLSVYPTKNKGFLYKKMMQEYVSTTLAMSLNSGMLQRTLHLALPKTCIGTVSHSNQLHLLGTCIFLQGLTSSLAKGLVVVQKVKTAFVLATWTRPFISKYFFDASLPELFLKPRCIIYPIFM